MSDWQDSPTVFLTGKVCPWGCGSTSFVHGWTSDNGDGSKTQYQICRRCSRRVRFVVEILPPSGDSVIWPTDN